MNANDPNLREEALFEKALSLPSQEAREAFLRGACGDDAELRQRVERLIASHERAGGFMKTQRVETLHPTIEAVPLSEGPGTVIGRYKLLQQIGEGGMGVVYMAEQREPVTRKVALKIIKVGMDTRQVVARFEAERQALALMDHPNIARVLDGGATETGRPYFVMELVQGVPITEFCDKNKLSAKERLKLFIQVCQAIQSAHQKGIIHRDIKPSNVLVTLHNGEPCPKVIDFGIAKATNQKLTEKTLFTQYATMIGTPAYMSPEQAEMSSMDVDTRTDVYALGVLLYELLTGTTPFPEKRLRSLGYGEMQRVIREEEPERPSTRLSTMANEQKTVVATNRGEELASLSKLLRGDLDWVVMKCLEKDRTRRYDTANGLAADIHRHLKNEPVTARPPSTAYKLQKAFRRNKVVFTATSAVAIALVVGMGISTWQMFQARQAEREAESARNDEQQQRTAAQSAQRVAEAERVRANTQAQKASESQQHARRLLYASDMNLAQQSLKLNNLGKARQLLDRHRPQPGEEDLRGWEWRYLWQLTRSSALVTLTNRQVRGFSVSFSPDGTRLAVGWFDGRVDLWDVPGRRRIRALTGREFRHWPTVAFSPVRNLLAATSGSEVVALYDLDSNEESVLWRAPDQGAWYVHGLAFSPDGSRVVIYAGSPEHDEGKGIWVVNASSSQIESRHSQNLHMGYGLSPDNRRLYLGRRDASNNHYRIHCLDLVTGLELWQTEPERDSAVNALALSPDGRLLASSSKSEDSTIRVWDAATGQFLRQLPGHTSFVWRLVFSRDGRHLISAGSDQTIRFWDTSNWTEMRVLRGHTDELHDVAISEAAQLVASTGKDGNLMLWKADAKSAADGYRRLSEDLGADQILPLDQSRVLLLPPDKPPELVDLKRDALPVSLPELGSAANVLGWFGTNILCLWNGTNQILVRELRGAEFVQRGAVMLDSGTRPTGFTFNVTRQLVSWTEGSSSNSVYLENLAAPARRIELRSDVAGLVPFRFSEDGKYLAATRARDSLRAWNLETGQTVAAIGTNSHATFAVGGRVLVVAVDQGSDDHEIAFYDLAHPGQPPRRVFGRFQIRGLAVSPDGGLVASTTNGGRVRLYDPVKGEWIEDLHGHLNAAFGTAFSPDGRRLISTFGGQEAVKLWDVGTRQELLTLAGTGSYLPAARWSADGDVILVGAPWQAWRAPSFEEIAAAEAKEKTENNQP